MHTFGDMHDQLVGSLTSALGEWVDPIVNIPSMPITYSAAALTETFLGFGEMLDRLIDSSDIDQESSEDNFKSYACGHN